MPVQINEIIIRAVVDPRPASGTGQGMDCPPPGNSGQEADVLEKLLEIINEKRER